MHETDMTKALIMTVRDWWESQPAPTKVEKVHLTVGAFTCVEPASLQFAFKAQTRSTFLEGSELVIRETPLIAFCHPCKKEYSPVYGSQYGCPTCGQPMEDIRSGRELKIDRVECAEIPTAIPAAIPAAVPTAMPIARDNHTREKNHASNL